MLFIAPAYSSGGQQGSSSPAAMQVIMQFYQLFCIPKLRHVYGQNKAVSVLNVLW